MRNEQCRPESAEKYVVHAGREEVSKRERWWRRWNCCWSWWIWSKWIMLALALKGLHRVVHCRRRTLNPVRFIVRSFAHFLLYLHCLLDSYGSRIVDDEVEAEGKAPNDWKLTILILCWMAHNSRSIAACAQCFLFLTCEIETFSSLQGDSEFCLANFTMQLMNFLEWIFLTLEKIKC